VKTLQKILAKNKKITSAELAKKLNISRQAAHKNLSKLVATGILVKIGSTRQSFYLLPAEAKKLSSKEVFRLKLKNKKLEEDVVLQKLKTSKALLRGMNEEAKNIFDYAFSEMLNNAIEHSQSPQIEISLEKIRGAILCQIRDFGIGVFRSIKKNYKLSNEEAAIQDLLKGKMTTAPAAHSGEGIFFTSKAVGTFTLCSFGWELSVNNHLQDVFLKKITPTKGTSVRFTIKQKTTQELKDVFDKYTNKDFSFQKTEIRLKLFELGTNYLSRSQARRVLTGLEKFEKIILDFTEIETIGQGFADEVFRVWKNKHPQIELQPMNCAAGVNFMIKHVGGEVKN